jgi:hypothetical protein
MEKVKRVGYGSGPFGSYGFGGQPISLVACPTTTKYSGDTLILQATPKDGTGPYYVEFMIDGMAILGDDPLGRPYTIPSAVENETIIRIYTISDADIAGASEGVISVSVYVQDSCPIEPMTCTESCIINIGCMAPVCNFTVT